MEERLTNLKEAVSLIKEGDIVAIGGVGRNRAPMALVREIVRQGIGHLHLVGREKGMDFDVLIGAGLVRKVTAAYIGLEELGLAPNFRRWVEAGQLEMDEQTCGSVINSLRAGSMGIPFLPVKGLWGSELMRVHQDFKPIECPFTGERLIALPAINPDVALVHAQKADKYGNIQLKGSLFEDALMAKAAKRVIVSVEEIVPLEQIKENPEETSIPYFLVDAVVELPRGAHPTSCYLYYASDRQHIQEYARKARSPESFRQYLEEYVLGPESHEKYLEKISEGGRSG